MSCIERIAEDVTRTIFAKQGRPKRRMKERQAAARDGRWHQWFKCACLKLATLGLFSITTLIEKPVENGFKFKCTNRTKCKTGW